MSKSGIRIFLTVLITPSILFFLLAQNLHHRVSAADITAPRAPLVPKIENVDQLVPFAKIILQRDYIGQRMGWSIRGGERVVLETSTKVHPLVREAFTKALWDLNCQVDVILHGQRRQHDGWDSKGASEQWAKNIVRMAKERLSMDFNSNPGKGYGFGSSGGPRSREPGISLNREEALRYDVVMSGAAGAGGAGGAGTVPGRGSIHPWTSPELLASVGEIYPGYLIDLMDQKSWEVVRNAERVEISDLQGSKASFTWFPEWWEIIDGKHPKVRNPGFGSTMGAERPGRSEYAYFAGHVSGIPAGYAAIEQSDFSGILTGTTPQLNEQIPRLTLIHDRGELTKIQGGGSYGDMWREMLALTQDIQYPGYPRPGTGWISEFAMGTNPKIIGPMVVEELLNTDRDTQNIRWQFARDRSGVFHAGYGTLAVSWWATMMDMPVNHYHLFLYFVTHIVHTRDGRTVTWVDRGRPTILDDPEVRALAATFGNPDQMLSRDWVPGIAADGSLTAPKAKLVSYEEFIESMPFKLDDPRLIYRIPDQLEPLYGSDRVRYYNPEEYLSFYEKLGQVPVKRVKLN